MVQGVASDYSQFEYDKILTRCPQGTGDDGSDTKNRIEQCMINARHKLLDGELTIRPPDGQSMIKQNTNTN